MGTMPDENLLYDYNVRPDEFMVTLLHNGQSWPLLAPYAAGGFSDESIRSAIEYDTSNEQFVTGLRCLTDGAFTGKTTCPDGRLHIPFTSLVYGSSYELVFGREMHRSSAEECMQNAIAHRGGATPRPRALYHSADGRSSPAPFPSATGVGGTTNSFISGGGLLASPSMMKQALAEDLQNFRPIQGDYATLALELGDCSPNSIPTTASTGGSGSSPSPKSNAQIERLREQLDVLLEGHREVEQKLETMLKTKRKRSGSRRRGTPSIDSESLATSSLQSTPMTSSSSPRRNLQSSRFPQPDFDGLNYGGLEDPQPPQLPFSEDMQMNPFCPGPEVGLQDFNTGMGPMDGMMDPNMGQQSMGFNNTFATGPNLGDMVGDMVGGQRPPTPMHNQWTMPDGGGGFPNNMGNMNPNGNVGEMNQHSGGFIPLQSTQPTGVNAANLSSLGHTGFGIEPSSQPGGQRGQPMSGVSYQPPPASTKHKSGKSHRSSGRNSSKGHKSSRSRSRSRSRSGRGTPRPIRPSSSHNGSATPVPPPPSHAPTPRMDRTGGASRLGNGSPPAVPQFANQQMPMGGNGGTPTPFFSNNSTSNMPMDPNPQGPNMNFQNDPIGMNMSASPTANGFQSGGPVLMNSQMGIPEVPVMLDQTLGTNNTTQPNFQMNPMTQPAAPAMLQMGSITPTATTGPILLGQPPMGQQTPSAAMSNMQNPQQQPQLQPQQQPLMQPMGMGLGGMSTPSFAQSQPGQVGESYPDGAGIVVAGQASAGPMLISSTDAIPSSPLRGPGADGMGNDMSMMQNFQTNTMQGGNFIQQQQPRANTFHA